MQPIYMLGSEGKRGEYVMKYKTISVWSEPENEKQSTYECVAYALTKKELSDAIQTWSKCGERPSRSNPYQFWYYEIISIERVE